MTTLYNQFDGECIFATPDPSKEYHCSNYRQSTGFTKLIKWVLLTKKNPVLEKNIEKYIKKHPKEINKKNALGFTALFLASFNTNTVSTENTVKILIDAGADRDSIDIDGLSILFHVCAYSGKDSTENTVKMLIDAGVDLNKSTIYNATPIMSACSRLNENSTENTVKMLIDAGADTNICTVQGYTAIMMVCKSDRPGNVVKMLIDANVELNTQDIYGNTALFYCIISKKYEYARLLIEAGAKYNIMNKYGATVLNYLLNNEKTKEMYEILAYLSQKINTDMG